MNDSDGLGFAQLTGAYWLGDVDVSGQETDRGASSGTSGPSHDQGHPVADVGRLKRLRAVLLPVAVLTVLVAVVVGVRA